MFEELKGKKVLFISTKNLDYLRNTQEIRLLAEQASQLDVIAFPDKSYPLRLMKVFWKLLRARCRQYQAVFVGFAPQLVVPFWGWKLKKSRLYIDFFISMYDTLCFDRKKVSPASFLGKRLLGADRRTLSRADVIVADTRAHGEYFCRELGADPDKVKVLYLEADREIYYPHRAERPREAEGKYVVLYFGSVLPLQGVDIVLGAAELLKDRKEICFYIIGPVNGKLQAPQGGNIHYIPWLDQKKLSDYIAFSDLCLAGHFCASIDKARRTIPGKAYIYRAMEKPMILGDNAANRELYSDREPGIYFVEMGSSAKLAEKIMAIKKERDQNENFFEKN